MNPPTPTPIRITDSSRPTSNMYYNYIALIQGGEGPDVWDKELKLTAADIEDAVSMACGRAKEMGGHVVEVAQNDWHTHIAGSLFSTKRTLQRLHERVHSGYDFNADIDNMTIEVANILGP